MGDKSGIQWTEATWNPVVGCSRVSSGCKNCYAEALHAGRLNGVGVYPSYRPWTPENAEHNVTLVPERLDQPLRWTRPRMIFVNSMSDLFHERVPDAYIARIFAVMALAPRHTFQVLTKRPDRMADLLSQDAFWDVLGSAIFMTGGKAYERARRGLRLEIRVSGGQAALPNVWLGTSIENRAVVSRADHLRRTPAAVRWISAEPLIGPLIPEGYSEHSGPVLGRYWKDGRPMRERPPLSLEGIDWLVVGGESGAGHRPIRSEWVRDLRDACMRTWTPESDNPGLRRPAFFFKQWGGATPKAGGRTLDGRTYDEYPIGGS